MNIAHILPYTARFPLQKHNGRYEWALRLAKEQVKNGHTVTIYAGPSSGDTTIIWQSLPAGLGDKIRNNSALFRQAFASEHDIFHSHFDSLHYTFAHLTNKPIVCTQHWFPNQAIALTAHTYKSANVFMIPVTRFMEQEDARLGIPTHEMIYHGIDLSLFQPSLEPTSDRLIFFGRITPAKGVREAVMLARATASSLDIIGKVNESDKKYWEDILPYVDGQKIRYLGALTQPDIVTHLQKAKGFLFPSQAIEAFGQVIIEAQACGVPVIISDTGAASELVQNGVTGLVCRTDQEFIDAIAKLPSLNRDACRAFAENFSAKTMVARYEALYESLVSL